MRQDSSARVFPLFVLLLLLSSSFAVNAQEQNEVAANNAKTASINVLIVKSGSELSAGNYDSAIELLKQAVAEKPTEPSLWIRLGQAQLAQAQSARKAHVEASVLLNEFQGAVATNQQALSLNSALATPSNEIDGIAHYELGLALIGAGDIRGATTAFEAAARSQPASASIYYRNEATELYNTVHLGEAIEAADKAIMIDPRLSDPYFIKGQSLLVRAVIDPKTQKLVLPPGCEDAYQHYLQLVPTGGQSDTVRRVLAVVNEQPAPNQVGAIRSAPQAQGVGTNQSAPQQSNDDENTDRQEKISQLRSDIDAQSQLATNDESSANQLLNNCSGPGAALCQALGQAGSARLRQKAAEARNRADSDREEIQLLEGQEVQASQRRDTSYGGSLQQVTTETGTNIQSAAAQQQADLQAMAAANQQRQHAQVQQPAPSTSVAAARSSAVNTAATSVPAATATPSLGASSGGNNPYSSAPAQGSYNPYTGTDSGSTQGSCTDMTASVKGTVKVGSDGWVIGYLTNNSNEALYVSYTFKQNGVPSTAMSNAGATTIQGGQTVGGEGQGLYSTGADKNPPEIYWYAVLKSEHDQYGCSHKW